MGSTILAPLFYVLTSLAPQDAAQAPSEDQLRRWIHDLGDDAPKVREEADARLLRADEAAVPLLRQHVGDSNAERAARAVQLLKRIHKPEVFKAASRLAEAPGPDAWQRELALVSALQARIEKELGRVPYARTASAWRLAKLPQAAPGAHSRVNTVLYSGNSASTGTVSGSAVVVDGAFAGKDGYVNGSVVVVTGDMTLEGYISDSVVVVGGKLKVGRGYVKDSMVLALGGMDLDGYAWGSVLGGRVQVNSYVQDCIILGELDAGGKGAREPDLRGVQTVKRAILDEALATERKAAFVLNAADQEMAKKEAEDLKQRRLSKPVAVGLVRIELDSPDKAKKLLESVGATVTEIDPDVAAERLSQFQVVYFASGWGKLSGLGDLAETYLKYLRNGGAILFARPEAGGTVEQAPALKLLPFPAKLSVGVGIGDNSVRVYTPGNPHPLAQGLKAEDLPYPFGYILEADPAWVFLAQGNNSKKPCLAAAECQKGRAVLHMTLDTHEKQYCSEKFLVAALEWLARVR